MGAMGVGGMGVVGTGEEDSDQYESDDFLDIDVNGANSKDTNNNNKNNEVERAKALDKKREMDHEKKLKEQKDKKEAEEKQRREQEEKDRNANPFGKKVTPAPYRTPEPYDREKWLAGTKDEMRAKAIGLGVDSKEIDKWTVTIKVLYADYLEELLGLREKRSSR
eukprot:TRINITY_DN1743_c0_g1_i2.p1 TRINITY_DN1743_c0_g1~~TRINITY_DN1743_c0_g1_i2.p1  ORF type:complete len:172 (-),score=48.32 TRINITY_DN1743_c0_g1_i2:406-900(-)